MTIESAISRMRSFGLLFPKQVSRGDLKKTFHDIYSAITTIAVSMMHSKNILIDVILPCQTDMLSPRISEDVASGVGKPVCFD